MIGAASLLASGAPSIAADYSSTDATDRQTLERTLFLCQWKSTHSVPEHAPIPAVCSSGPVSIDDAMLQDKQWWTFWARLNPDEALHANQQFSADFVAFQARLKGSPELAEGLLPADTPLPSDDWRVWLVHQLMQPQAARK